MEIKIILKYKSEYIILEVIFSGVPSHRRIVSQVLKHGMEEPLLALRASPITP